MQRSASRMTTAQEEYARLLKDYLGPRLRSLGFQGSSGRYALKDERVWRLLGFQKSTTNTQDRVRFYINLNKIERQTWARMRDASPHLSDTPNANIGYGGDTSWTRLQNRMPSSQNGWWNVLPDTDLAALSDSIIAALISDGLPWLTDTDPPTDDGRPQEDQSQAHSRPEVGPVGLLARWRAWRRRNQTT